MKKWIFVLALLLVFLCACTPSVEEKPPVSDDPVTPVTPVEPPAPTILDNKVLVDGALYSVENAYCMEGVQQKLGFLGENLLVYGPRFTPNGNARNHIALLDTATGQVIKSINTVNTTQVQLCGDKLALLEHYRGIVTFLDSQLEELKTIELDYTDGFLAVSPDGNTIYCLRPQNGLVVKNLSTGESTTLLQDARNLYGGELTETTLALSYTDQNTQKHVSAILDLTTAQVLHIPFEGVFAAPQKAGGYWLCSVFGENGQYFLGTETRPYSLTLTEKYSTAFLLHDPDRILVKRYTEEGMEMTLYTLDGTFLSRVLAEGTPTALVWWQGGYLFLSTDSTGCDRLMFWDAGTPASGSSLTLGPAYEAPPTGTVVSQSLYQRAEDLSKTYDVEISIAEQIDDDYRDFTAVPEYDEALISQALDTLEKVLSQFPENFLIQLRYGTHQALEIHLAGAVGKANQPENVSGFNSFVGFTETRAAKSVVVLDITRPATMGQTFCHELVHVIQGKLDFDIGLRENAKYSEEGWQALNPAGFVYANTYDEMPMEYFNDGYDAWFMDLYSRTYAKEDRCRILEHAMVGNTWMFSTPQRRAKLQYLCDCIRDSFDTTGWPETTFWEQAL